MHDIIPWYMFDCWGNPVVHLLLLNSSMTIPIFKQTRVTYHDACLLIVRIGLKTINTHFLVECDTKQQDLLSLRLSVSETI